MQLFESNNFIFFLFLSFPLLSYILFNHNKYIFVDWHAGFDVAGVACCSTGTFEMSYLCSEQSPLTCSDANKYVFWDAFHPTEKTNRIIVDHFIDKLLKKYR
jgi:hypothetical protein